MDLLPLRRLLAWEGAERVVVVVVAAAVLLLAGAAAADAVALIPWSLSSFSCCWRR
jgi:hypothetical protein